MVQLTERLRVRERQSVKEKRNEKKGGKKHEEN